MTITAVTKWATYLIPEDKIKEFNDDVEFYEMMDMPIWLKEEYFDKLWIDYKLVPA